MSHKKWKNPDGSFMTEERVHEIVNSLRSNGASARISGAYSSERNGRIRIFDGGIELFPNMDEKGSIDVTNYVQLKLDNSDSLTWKFRNQRGDLSRVDALLRGAGLVPA